MAKNKVPEYTRKAIQGYQARHDHISCVLPLGTKDRIRNLTGESVNAFINRVVLAELEKLEGN